MAKSQYFPGIRYRTIATYGNEAKNASDEFDNYNDAMKFVTEHNEKGGSVQVQKHHWKECLEDDGWFPSRLRA